MDANGEFFRSFAKSFVSQNNLDASQVWTMGYSGGAEFITYELTDHNTSWRNGGGSIMVAGGDSDGSVDADATTKASPMYWWVGAKDTSGNTYPVTWSARGAVESGYNAYLGAGFSDARVKLIDGFSHHDYDLPHILASSLDFAGKTPHWATATCPTRTRTTTRLAGTLITASCSASRTAPSARTHRSTVRSWQPTCTAWLVAPP